MNTLYLLTEYYPTGDRSQSEHAFISPELPELLKSYDKVILVPSLVIEKQENIKMDGHSIEVDYSLSEKLYSLSKITSIFYSLTSKLFFKEIYFKGVRFWNKRRIKSLIYAIGRAKITREWVINKTYYNTDIRTSIFYTYWFNEITLGISQIKDLKVITRAHGYDIFEDHKEKGGYIPLYKDKVRLIKLIIVPSRAAEKYIISKFPIARNKVRIAHLGVSGPKRLSDYSKDNILRVVSCAYLNKIKRVHLIPLALQALSECYNLEVEWVHFGDGPEKTKILSTLAAVQSTKLRFKLYGNTKNEAILAYYENNPVDLFLHTSLNEGGAPLSLQEAQAHGIPIVSTNAGGVADIFGTNQIGILLNINPTPQIIADAIYDVISDKNKFLQMRKNSFDNWKQNFNAENNSKLVSTLIQEFIYA